MEQCSSKYPVMKTSQNDVIVPSTRGLLRCLIVLTTLGATLAIEAATKYELHIQRSRGRTTATIREAGHWRGDTEHKDARERVDNLLRQQGLHGFNKLEFALSVVDSYYNPRKVSGLPIPFATDAWLLWIVGNANKYCYDPEDDPKSPSYIDPRAMAEARRWAYPPNSPQYQYLDPRAMTESRRMDLANSKSNSGSTPNVRPESGWRTGWASGSGPGYRIDKDFLNHEGWRVLASFGKPSSVSQKDSTWTYEGLKIYDRVSGKDLSKVTFTVRDGRVTAALAH